MTWLAQQRTSGAGCATDTGNGPFTLRQGGILVGEACPPGFVIHSQDTFLQLYDRIKKVIARKGEVVVEVVEEMG